MTDGGGHFDEPPKRKESVPSPRIVLSPKTFAQRLQSGKGLHPVSPKKPDPPRDEVSGSS